MTDFADVAQKLAQPGAVGVIPTDTVYGLVARTADRAAVARLYSLKHRHHKPGTLIAANLEQLEAIGLKHRYLKAVEQFWPGAVSVVVPISNSNLHYLSLGQNSLAVRLPGYPALNKLLLQTGALLTTSANHPAEPTATSVKQAKNYFGGEVDFYLDGGDLSGHQPSTIIRIVDDAIEILRQGAVTIKPNKEPLT